MHVDELTPDMGHAGDLADIAGSIEFLEPGIAIGVHPAAISGKMILGVFAFAVEREAIPAGGRDGAAPRALVPAVSQSRAIWVLPMPGASIATGVSSAKIA